ncbi:MAG: 4-alpha-glucanotransferase [Gammaproteobacteria bacterium]|nr:4-alpha-glucanotransferase [Gammaproteobacteria bacterium]MCP5423491.1 4-alpha-glucanotransferase [Gammaproteobacteria bacterium]
MSALDRLAALAGIEPFYHDVLGNLHEADSGAKRTLLNALGFAVTDDGAVEKSMQAHEQRSWRRTLEPIVIIPAEQQPGTVPITLPVDPAGAFVQWTLTEEDGAVHEGRVNLTDLPVTAIYTIDERLVERRGLRLPEFLPEGYHKLSVRVEYADLTTQVGSTSVVVAPRTCYGPQDAVPDTRLWGVAVQLYSLRSARNWGMGDFTDLLHLVERLAETGASGVGLNPLHPLFPGNTSHISPYSPTSRCFFNTLYIDVTAVPDFTESAKARILIRDPQFQADLERLRAAELVDYPAVAAHKYRILELLFASFQRRHIAERTPRGLAFEHFCDEMGPALEQLALFDALYEYFHSRDENCWSWRKDWPTDFQRPHSPVVGDFAKKHRDRVNFFKYLQWVADEQLAAVARRARQLGMPVGLYMDLAVGVDPNGGEAWGDHEMLISEATSGAPPDPLNRLGQNWGLAPINPVALQERGFAPLIAALRSNMRHAGALRIDHVMGLMRLYWIPGDRPPTAGMYVRYPLESMLRILALESRRHQCLVIGEDLGTVPDGFRDVMNQAGLLSYKVLYFERWPDGLFKRVETHPEQSLVTISTHDLPPLGGWWMGRDVEWRIKLSLYPNKQMQADDVASRPVDRRFLLDALVDAEAIEPEAAPSLEPPVPTEAFRVAVHRMLARSPGRFMVIQMEDALDVVEQANLPGTVDEHPNWRRKLPLSVDELFNDASLQAILAVLREERPRPIRPVAPELAEPENTLAEADQGMRFARTERPDDTLSKDAAAGG